MSFLPWVKLWLWISVVATVAGWTLSALGELNRGGYAIFFATASLPLAFALLSLLVLLGGFLYPPTNHTALTYRLPRVLQWLAHGHWFWIHTLNYRMNDRACGIEWLSAPLLLFTKSDRGLFLLNFIPFLLMPGLVFSFFTCVGVRPRA